MPQETEPADVVPDPAESASGRSVLRPLGCGCAVLAALASLVVLVTIVPLVWGSMGSTDFPRVPPKDMASRAFQRSQEAYDVVGFTRTVQPGVEDIGVSTENTLSSGFCYDGGLLGMEDETVDGAYGMSHSWALDHVPAQQAVPGLRRLHQHFKDDGWTITSYRAGEKGRIWELFVQRDDGAERMSFSWYPDREYFTGGASVPCAYDPGWKSGDTGPSGDDLWPPALGAAPTAP